MVDQLAQTLTDITRHEVDMYGGKTFGGRMIASLDDKNQVYAVMYVPDNQDERPSWVVVLARVVGDYVVIEEDVTDKPLVDALMVNANVPREKIILAYRGETLPEQTD